METITDEMWKGLNGRDVGFECNSPTVFSTFSLAAQNGFQCYECGKCCYTTTITVSIMEARAIAKYLSMSFKEFMKEHIVREANSQYGFVFKTTAPCAFLVDKKCTIYEVRPSVCRNYPFLTRGPNAMPNTIYVPGSCEAAREAWNRIVSVVGVK